MAKKKPDFKMRVVKEPLLAEDDNTSSAFVARQIRLEESSPGFAKLSHPEKIKRLAAVIDDRFSKQVKKAGGFKGYEKGLILKYPNYFRAAAKRLNKGEAAQERDSFTDFGVNLSAKYRDTDKRSGRPTKTSLAAERKKEAGRINRILDEASAIRKAAEAKVKK